MVCINFLLPFMIRNVNPRGIGTLDHQGRPSPPITPESVYDAITKFLDNFTEEKGLTVKKKYEIMQAYIANRGVDHASFINWMNPDYTMLEQKDLQIGAKISSTENH